jgi:hypothetical protein
MGPAPSKKMSIERINNSGNYTHRNCCWADDATQKRNRRDNVYLTFNNETLIVRDWEVRLGMRKGTLRMRLWNGWGVERALTTAVRRHRGEK